MKGQTIDDVSCKSGLTSLKKNTIFNDVNHKLMNMVQGTIDCSELIRAVKTKSS